MIHFFFYVTAESVPRFNVAKEQHNPTMETLTSRGGGFDQKGNKVNLRPFLRCGESLNDISAHGSNSMTLLWREKYLICPQIITTVTVWYSHSREIETAVAKLNTEFIAKTSHWMRFGELVYGLSISLVRTTPVAAAELLQFVSPPELLRESYTHLFIPVCSKLI